MRPLAGELGDSSSGFTDRPSGSKRRSSGSPSGSSSNAPTSFFFRTEEEVEQTADDLATPQQDSTYGVRSLESTVDAGGYADTLEHGEGMSASYDRHPEHRHDTVIDHPQDHHDLRPRLVPLSLSHPRSTEHSAPSSPLRRHPSCTAISQPLTPLHAQSPGLGTESAPVSTPKSVSIRSLRLSDDEGPHDDAASSQAITSDNEEEDEEHVRNDAVDEANIGLSLDTPQLVMPSIKMPSRRPFTDNGKRIGKLKIMVAGGRGTGKTSLIKSIVRSCEDIVHVDTGSSLTPSLRLSQLERRKTDTRTNQITEIFASTRAYPSWWSDLEESRVLKRRASSGETVLERNVCFIDTPGSDDTTGSNLAMNYIESCLQRNKSFAAFSEGELLSIFSGNGGVQVDLVLYVLSNTFQPGDVDFLRRLSQLTNVIPIVGKADLTTQDEIPEVKASILKQLLEEDIRPFFFGQTVSELLHSSENPLPYAVSSALSNDDENMDASLLMSPDYVQPLVCSDLYHLVQRVFDPDTAAWLRHSASKKFLTWLRASLPDAASSMPNTSIIHAPSFLHNSTTNTSGTSSVFSSPSPSQVLVSLPRPKPHLPFTTHAHARLADHTEREERLAQIHLARWAADLQRAVRNERMRFEAVHREERVQWLVERLEDATTAGSSDDERAAVDNNGVGPPADAHGDAKPRRRTHLPRQADSPREQRGPLDARDPLGLIEWDERVRRGSLVVVKVLGGCSLMGALAVWWWRWGWFHE